MIPSIQVADIIYRQAYPDGGPPHSMDPRTRTPTKKADILSVIGNFGEETTAAEAFGDSDEIPLLNLKFDPVLDTGYVHAPYTPRRRVSPARVHVQPWRQQVAKHLKHGAKTAAVDEASELALNLAREGLYGVKPVREALEEPLVRELSKLGVGIALHEASLRRPDVVPRPDSVQHVAGLVVENATRNLSAGALGAFREKLENIADVADEIDVPAAELPAGESDDETADPETRHDREAVPKEGVS